jgi:anti-sigma factor RsiW
MSKHKSTLKAVGHSGNGGGQDSQCYFVQLQIDSFLDGDLSSAQQDSFMEHMSSCQACSSELQFARVVHDSVLDLPLLDCPESALEPIDRLGRNEKIAPTDWWLGVRTFFEQLPMTVRYAFPAVLAVAVTLVLVSGQNGQHPTEMLADQATVVEQEYSQADVVAALADLNTAIDYLNEVSQRTESMIGGRFVVMPLQDSLNASFERLQDEENDPLTDDPI